MDPFWDHFAPDIGEAVIPTLKSVSKFQVIESKLMQHRGVQVVDVHTVLGCVPANLISFSVGKATLEPTTGHCHAE